MTVMIGKPRSGDSEASVERKSTRMRSPRRTTSIVGPFDNTKIRQVLPASSGRTNIGMFSTLHDYPTSQRFYTISSSGSRADANESITVPTADGVNVGIEARRTSR